jgi:hypothetical protein
LARFDCLECWIAGTPIHIPVRDLDQVVEYSLTAPPPLAPRWIGGLSLVGDDVCTSIAVAGFPIGPQSACKGLLLRAPRSERRYIVQVDGVGGIVSVEDGGADAAVSDWPCPKGWLVIGAKDVLRLETETVATALFGDATLQEGSGATPGRRS